MNLGINTITAIGHQPAKILKSPHIESLCRRILVDGLKVARAEQINFEDHIIDDILNIYNGYPDEMGTSMYYDVINKHPLEVEAIQGYIYKCARKHHLETPYLDMAYYTLITSNTPNQIDILGESFIKNMTFLKEMSLFYK